ncbi:MAG: P1 family peptidase [Pseudomonadota bacterium]
MTAKKPMPSGGPGPHNDLTDISGVLVGHAEDALAKTGVTAVLFDNPALIAGDVRGGGPGTRETDLLDPSTLVERADAVVLSGGSSYGLGAADGAAGFLGARGRGFQLVPREGVPPSPIVPAAILYDLANGGDKNWATRGDGRPPYVALGEAACMAASAEPIRLGRAGAGFGAQAGAAPGGVGSASFVTADGLRVAALIAVNSFGSAKMPYSDVFWAWPYEWDREFGGARPEPNTAPAADLPGDTKLGPLAAPTSTPSGDTPNAPTNTTIGVIAIDGANLPAALTQASLTRIAVMAQDGLARAIRPIHGPTDGDVLFAAATTTAGTSDGIAAGAPIDAVTLTRLGAIAADVCARAAARAVYEAEKGDAVET